jgi:methyl-accepting chemotaxis protein
MGVFALLAMHFITTRNINSLSSALVSSDKNLSLVKAQGTADMLHDGLRADFFHALANSGCSQEVEQEIRTELQEHITLFKENIELVRTNATDETMKSAIEQVQQPLANYITMINYAVPVALHDTQHGQVLKDSVSKLFKALEEPMGRISDLIEATSSTQSNQAQQTVSSAQSITLYTIGAGIVLCLFIGWIISGNIIGAVKQISTSAQKMSAGDYTAYVSLKSQDEIGVLAEHYNSLVRSINVAMESTVREQQKTLEMANRAELLAQQSEENNQYLAKSIEEILFAMNELSNGNLTVRLDVRGGDEIASLFAGFNSTASNLANIIESITTASFTAASVGQQISAGTEEMSIHANEQSKQVIEIAAAIEQMSRTIEDNATLAEQTSTLAHDSRNTALSGSSVIKQSIEKVSEIAHAVESVGSTVQKLGERSNEIGDIVSVIKEIASQTNLLALNAAIEAARAGEQGRGFAVVADEVRKLAERTQTSTKEIETKISSIQLETNNAVTDMQSSMTLVSEGITLSGKAGESLERIVGSIEQVVETSEAIARANSEQALTSTMVARNIDNLSTASNEMSSSVTEIARAINDLSGMTNNMQSLTSRFITQDSPLVKKGAYKMVQTVHSTQMS